MRSNFEFHCPKCGSFTFGSAIQPDESFERGCNGYLFKRQDDGSFVPIRCDFRWPESDDYRYMRRYEIYDSKKEYEEARKKR